MDEPTDRDLITDHPFKQGAVWDDCVADIDGWPCGFSEDEHGRLEGATEGGEAIEQP
jgi:hypothetical protein